MPPKTRVSEEEIISGAIKIIREHSAEALNARRLAAELGISTQPIFSNFATMEALFIAVIKKANQIFEDYRKKEIESGKFPPYKASGMAYIRFAKEEKELFKLLYMRNRKGDFLSEEDRLYQKMYSLVQENNGVDENTSKLFHLEMWAYVHGIATMFATEFLDLDWDLVSKMLTDSYQGLRKEFKME